MSAAASKSTPESDRLRVLVLGSGQRPRVASEAERLRPAIEAHAEIVVWDLEFEQDLSQVEADLAVVLGGDGSILRAVKQMGYRQWPVVGVNLGKLGFLADLDPDEFIERLPDLCQRRYRVIRHVMFECSLLRGGKVVHQCLGLNEVVAHAGAPFHMLSVHLYVDAELVTTYSCDGLLISTPVGSTAHGLSAGGPILRQDLDAFLILPISPHTLTNRPVVDTADRVLEMAFEEPNEGSTLVVDGQVVDRIRPGDRVRVERAKPQFTLVELPGHTYYKTLREKLGWGGQLHPNGASGRKPKEKESSPDES